jgi:hypothetical protein
MNIRGCAYTLKQRTPAVDFDKFGVARFSLRLNRLGKRGRPAYKCHPDAGRGTRRRMIDVLRFVVGLAADVVRRRAGLVAGERAASTATHRGAAEARG